MLSNNVISSVPNTSDGGYDPVDPNVWANTKCWHFTPGSYILQENLAYAQLIPATDYTIGGWFKLIHDGSTDNSFVGHRIYRTIYTMLNGDSTSHMSMMYGSMYGRRLSTRMQIGSTNETDFPISYLYLSTDSNDANPNTLNQWIFLAIRAKTSAGDDNVDWIVNGDYRGGNSSTYVQQPNWGNYAIKIGGEDFEFYVSELGVWKDNLPDAALLSLYNNGTPVSFQENIGSYADANGKDKLVAYYRFGDGTDDRVTVGDMLLHDETNTDNSSTATDLTSMIGEIHQVPLQNAG